MGELAPADGKHLVHYAVHYNSAGGDVHPSEYFFSIPETPLLFAGSGAPERLIAAWREDPLGRLSEFRDDLERREFKSPSNTRTDGKRPLSSRETAIFVARFLTYTEDDDASGEDRAVAPVRQRQADVLGLPGRVSPGFRRFDPERGLASTGHYWHQFAAELVAYLGTQADQEHNVDDLPQDTQRLLRYAARYENELRAQILGEPADPEMYVQRDVEEQLLGAIDRGQSPVLVRGEAGFGKSSLLWGVTGKLRDRGWFPVLVSATWLAAETDRLLTVTDLVEHLSVLSDAHMRPILLLDTADLLLHSEGLIYQANDLLLRLRTASITSVLTVRRIEEASLNQSEIAQRIELTGYNESTELPHAVRALMRRYLPSHQPDRGLELVSVARTRGLPAIVIFRSPLLLRMLFDLSEGALPAVDLDVTGLYERYWRLRVLRDQRSPSYMETGDMSGVAARLGILMLADASPAISSQRIETALARVDLPVALHHTPSQAIETLGHRGVLTSTSINAGDGWRFAHQALFEFVTAKGLLMRDGGGMLIKLVDHIREHPHDLFTGAVVEQLIILMADDPTTRARASEAVRTLLDTPSPSLRQIGVTAWCHIPELLVDDRLIQDLDKSSVARLLGHLPQVRDVDSAATIELLERAWRDHKGGLYRDFVSCLIRLIDRWPTAVGDFVARVGLIEYIVEEQTQTLIQPGTAIDLVMRLSTTHADYSRSLSLLLLAKLPDAAGRLQLLRETAPHWTLLGSDANYLGRVVAAAAKSAAKFGGVERDLGVATGEIMFQTLASEAENATGGPEEWWLSFATRVLDDISEQSLSTQDIAERHALGKHLCSSTNRNHIKAILDLVFDRDASMGPPKIVGSFLVEILKSDTLARQLIADHVYDKLANGLPARAEAGPSSEKRWAIAARAALQDPETPYEFIEAVTSGLLPQEPLLWRSPEYLLGAILPAALAGVARAAALANDVIRDPAQLAAGYLLPEQERLAVFELIETGQQYVGRDRLAADLVLSAALNTHRLGIIRALLAHATGRDAIQARIHEIGELCALTMRIANKQRDASGLMAQLQAHGLVSPTIAELGTSFESLGDPQARAAVIEMFPRVVQVHPDKAFEALKFIRERVLEKEGISEQNRHEFSDARRRLVDAGFSAYRAILAIVRTQEAWDQLWDLVREPPLHGRQAIEADRFHDIASSLRAVDIASVNGAVSAAERIVEVGRWVATHTSKKQSKRISHFLTTTTRRIIRGPHGAARRLLIDAAPDLPDVLGQTIVITSVGAKDRDYVQQRINSAMLTGVLADAALERMRDHREAGFQPIPWLLSATRTH